MLFNLQQSAFYIYFFLFFCSGTMRFNVIGRQRFVSVVLSGIVLSFLINRLQAIYMLVLFSMKN